MRELVGINANTSFGGGGIHANLPPGNIKQQQLGFIAEACGDAYGEYIGSGVRRYEQAH